MKALKASKFMRAAHLTWRPAFLRTSCQQRAVSQFTGPAVTCSFLRLHSGLSSRRIDSPPTQRTRRAYATSQMTDTMFPDPNRPDLFYHLVNAPTPVSQTLPAYAISFLKETPPSVNSAIILGWLPAQTHASRSEGGSGAKEQTSALNDFKENPKFIALLHTSVKSALLRGVDDIWINGAIQYQNGWMHIHDQRNIPALDRIGDSEDIIASIFVENGVMNVSTYEPMPSYRICTADGITQLTPGLAKHLQDDLSKLSQEVLQSSD
ncbi:hypothetical protein D9619_007869 [Psilocybe cf. subviscida]|uniref:Uncharacterized protein n=1 Tax=Psilocybe cf. subviscida TaxID=2480587 RepID=A0A8H5ATH9_9AGAR|nr:hypothetical protein D9619_007869 [Psilocybe cf. subviscida]